MKKKLVRLDKLIVDREMLLSRTLAQGYIADGRVKVDGITIKKTASMVPFDCSITVDAPQTAFPAQTLSVGGVPVVFEVNDAPVTRSPVFVSCRKM